MIARNLALPDPWQIYLVRVVGANFVSGVLGTPEQQRPGAGLHCDVEIEGPIDQGRKLSLGVTIHGAGNRGSRYRKLLCAVDLPYTPPGLLDPVILIDKRFYIQIEHRNDSDGLRAVVSDMFPKTSRPPGADDVSGVEAPQ